MKNTATKTIDRTKYIGGSDAGAILNKNDYRSRLKVYSDKVYGEDDDLRSKRPIMRGNRMEAIIEQMAKEELEPTINSPEMFERYHKGVEGDPQIYLFDERGVGQAPIGGHPDGLSEGTLWEFKAPSMYTLDTIKTNGIPDSWHYQVQHYMMLANVPLAKVVALDYDSWVLYVVDIPSDAEVQNQMLEAYDDFWWFVTNEIEPPLLGGEIDLFADQDTSKLDEMLEDYVVQTELRYGSERIQKDLRGKILSMIGNTPVLHTERFSVTQSNVDKGSYSYTRLVVRPR